MSDIRVKLDREKVTLWDMEKFEGDEKQRWTWLIDFLSRMAVDENGDPLPYEDAKAEIRKLTWRESDEYVRQMLEQVSVPKATDTA